MAGSGNGNQSGSFQLISNSGSGVHYGSYNYMQGIGTGVQYGSYQQINNTGSAPHYGNYNYLLGAGTGPQFGTFQTISNSGNNTHYGNYNTLIGSGSGSHYGSYNLLNGGAGVLYGNYQSIASSGNASHYGSFNLLQGVGTGLQYGSYQRIVNTGSNTHYGSYNSLEGTSTGIQYGSFQSISNSGSGLHYGIYNLLSGAGIGSHYGTLNSIQSSGSGSHFGTYNSLTGNANGDQTGTMHYINVDGNGNQYATFNSIISPLSSSGNKYGSYNSISSSAGGTHYGLYSQALKAGSFAGYFQGTVTIGTTTANTYSLPAFRGTANQIMKTDGFGNVNWVNTSTIDDHDWYEIGTTNAPNNINDNIFTQGNVAIGTTTTANKLQVDGGRVEFTTTTDASGTAGTGVLEIANSLRIDGNEIITNTNNILYLQNDNGGDLRVDANTLVVDASANRVGIGTTAPSYNLQVSATNATIGLNFLEISDMGSNNLGLDGDIVPYGTSTTGYDLGNINASEHWDQVVGVSFVTFSDRRTKKDINSINYGLKEVLQLNPVSFRYLPKISPNNKEHLGLIAQEVEKIIPQVIINEDVDVDPDTGRKIIIKGEFKAINYSELIPVLVKAIQEQQKEIEELKSLVQQLISKQ